MEMLQAFSGRHFKMAAIEISEITFSAITQFHESIETRFWCLNPCIRG